MGEQNLMIIYDLLPSKSTFHYKHAYIYSFIKHEFSYSDDGDDDGSDVWTRGNMRKCI